MKPKSLRQLIADVETELQHAPQVAAHKEDIKAKLNETLREIGTELSWPWLYREHPIWAIPDIPVTPTYVASSLRRFQLAASELATKLWDSDEFADAWDARLSLQMQAQLPGMEFHVTGSGASVAGTNWWSFAPFVIDEVLADETTPEIILDPRAVFGTALGGSEGIELRQNRIRLPADVDEVVSIEDDDGRALIPASERELRLWGRGADRSPNTLSHYSYDHGFMRRHNHLQLPSLQPPGGAPAQFQEPGSYDYVTTMGLRDESWTAAAAAGGTIPVGTYELRICWWAAGIFGPMGDRSQQVTLTAGNRQIDLAGLPTLGTPGEYGRKLMVFLREVRSGIEVQGDYYLSASRADSTSTTLSITARPDVTLPHSQVRLSRIHPRGQYTYLRLWPRSSTLRKLNVYYYKRPDELEEPGDAPEFNPKYHDYLVWRTVEKLGARWDSVTASRARGEAERIQRAMESFYSTGQRAPRKKGQIDGASTQRWVDRFPNGVDWQG